MDDQAVNRKLCHRLESEGDHHQTRPKVKMVARCFGLGRKSKSSKAGKDPGGRSDSAQLG